MSLVTTAEFLDLIGAEPAGPAERGGPEYAHATSADIIEVAARLGWLSDGRWFRPAVPAGLPAAGPDGHGYRLGGDVPGGPAHSAPVSGSSRGSRG